MPTEELFGNCMVLETDAGFMLMMPDRTAAGFAMDRTNDYEVRVDAVPSGAVIHSQTEMTHATAAVVAIASCTGEMFDLILDDMDGAEKILDEEMAICALPDVCFTPPSCEAAMMRLSSGEWVPPGGVGDLLPGLMSVDAAGIGDMPAAAPYEASEVTHDTEFWQW